jgi:hypothetical protein
LPEAQLGRLYTAVFYNHDAYVEAQQVFWEAMARLPEEPSLYDSTILPLAAIVHHAHADFSRIFGGLTAPDQEDMRLLALAAPGLPSDPDQAAVWLDARWNRRYDEIRRALTPLESLNHLELSQNASDVTLYDVSSVLDGVRSQNAAALVGGLKRDSSRPRLAAANDKSLKDDGLLARLSLKKIEVRENVLGASKSVERDGRVSVSKARKFLWARGKRPRHIDVVTLAGGNIDLEDLEELTARVLEVIAWGLGKDVTPDVGAEVKKIRFTRVSA